MKHTQNLDFEKHIEETKIMTNKSHSTLNYENGGIIWITGYSSSGKTTVGRLVNLKLKKYGFKTILLDGDELRRIFGNKWGHTRLERIELGYTYFKLCNHIASQGITVIISAVVMYQEIADWVRSNMHKVLITYLDVPKKERVERDKTTNKNLYNSINNTDYDNSFQYCLKLNNFGHNTPEITSDYIVKEYQLKTYSSSSSKTNYWNEYYSNSCGTLAPSPFAIDIAAQHLKPGDNILEIGCGNGRDSSYFAEIGCNVKAIDISESAISLCKRLYNKNLIQFKKCTIEELANLNSLKFDLIYCRFVLHAMTEIEESNMLKFSYQLLNQGGNMLIECRSINDSMSRLGEVISPTERINGHYRRFIIPEELCDKLNANGFIIEDITESSGLAAHYDEDPIVLRINARKVSYK